MRATTREQAMTALETRFVNSGYFTTVSRQISTWDDIAPEQQPWLGIQEPIEDFVGGPQGLPAKLAINVILYIYARADQGQPGIKKINALLDQVESVLDPDAKGRSDNRCTLGGVVYSVRIEGQIHKDPGDTDGQTIALVPLRVLFP